MDLRNRDTFGADKEGQDNLNFHPSNLSLDWRFDRSDLTDTIPTENASCSSMSMVDSFCPNAWDPSSSQNIAFSENNVHAGNGTPCKMPSRGLETSSGGMILEKSCEIGWKPSNLVPDGVFLQGSTGVPPHSFSPISTDAGFIDRAARFSCFNGGCYTATNVFNAAESLSPHCRHCQFSLPDILPPNFPRTSTGAQNAKQELHEKRISENSPLPPGQGIVDGSPLKNNSENDNFLRPSGEVKQIPGTRTTDSDEAEFSGGGSKETTNFENNMWETQTRGLSAKKRKRSYQDTANQEELPLSAETSKDNLENEQKDEKSLVSSVSKPTGKQCKDVSQISDGLRDDYIHVRARRGQATNSHSLAERVRREKISERMKLLQDLVPGCNKVTGKAVMLDEIINYVQSLQRQVEFLSMKLAAVNPCLDFNIDGLLSKDLLQLQGTSSCMIGLAPDSSMPFPHLQLSQQGLVQTGMPGMESSSETPRPINPHVTAMNGYKASAAQIPRLWDNELHNVIQMNFGGSMSITAQELHGSLPPGHMKLEL